jgi:poly-gamma-glutamate synthesis protein (capsule biosynthesis protein)
MEDKEYTFRVDPEFVSVPSELGVDLVTIANNHILDFGREPLTETLKALDGAGIAHVGAGENLAQAKQWETLEAQGKKIAFLGASRVYPESSWSAGPNHSGVFSTYDSTQLVEQIRQAKESSDYVFVLVHWGIELSTEPEDYQRSLARQYIDAGADAVIGSHPHVLQGIEYYQGKPIFYSLGNFIFSNREYESILVELTLSGEGEQVRLVPCVSRSNRMQLLTDTQEYYSSLQELSFGIEIGADGMVREKSG